jgi:hypothetical protein
MAVSSVSLNQGLIGAAATPTQAETGQRNPNQLQTQSRDETNSSSRTQLSDLGRTRLALDDLRDATETARNLDNPPSLSEFRNAVQGVVQSLNALNQTVRNGETSTSDRRTQQILDEVRTTARNTTTDDGENALQRLGIATQQDGTFTVNQRQLDQAFQDNPEEAQAVLDNLSDNLNRVADQLLNGRPPQAESNDIAQQAQTIRQAIIDEEAREQQRSQQDARESFRQLLAAQLANVGSFSARNAITTYFNVSTL